MPPSTATLQRNISVFSILLLTSLGLSFTSYAQTADTTATTAAEASRAQFARGNAGSVSTSIADLVEEISPAVVNIIVTSTDGDTVSEGQGSGFIISRKGEVVTNYHVIEGGTEISVAFNNGVTFPSKIVGTDQETDLALLQIESDQEFRAVSWYHGDPIRIGDWVIAIGNPFGIGQSTSLGIISAIGRDRVESGSYVDYIQTDATINRGNSGGPLFNPRGEVVGVNSAIFSPTGASVGIGFSIPHQTAEEVINAIRKDGRVRRGWLGVGLRTAEYTTTSGALRSGGANINNVVAGSPASKAGLKVDDIILKINGEPIDDAVEATRIIGRLGPGRNVTFVIERNETEMTVSTKMAERPDKDAVERAMSGASASAPSYSSPEVSQPYSTEPAPSSPSAGLMYGTGLSAVDLSSTFREAIGMRYDQVGVYVDSVQPGSPAASAGVKTNMVILEFNQEPIASVSALKNMIRDAQAAHQSDALLLVRLSDGLETYISLPLDGGRKGQVVYRSENEE